MSTASFSMGGAAVPLVFSVNPSYPCKAALCAGAVRVRTEGGGYYAYEKGGCAAELLLHFAGLPAAEFDGGFDYAAKTQAEGTQSLAGWFFGATKSGTLWFTYTDPAGHGHDVAFADNRLEFALTDNGLYDGAVRLVKVVGRP